ncbi:MAG TPA: response regulator transcription factor [Ktedonosporobacter sp.]|jgi:DNA-binding NarL/FixJ family response regulator|nr:response regulator transcription factor [Ktedonosporobacter sp.]
MTIRVLIVDDYPIVRAGLRLYLGRSEEIEIVAEASNGTEAIEKALALRPDITLMDLLLPDIDGIAATAIIHREVPETRIIILTSALDGASVAGAIRAGATSYLLKDDQIDELQAAVKATASGQAYFSPLASSYLMRELQEPEGPEPLTERETDVLHLLIQGRSNKEIALALNLAENTIKTHVRHIIAKFHVQNRTRVIIAATQPKPGSRGLKISS